MSVFPPGIKIDDINNKWLPKLDKSLGLKATELTGESLTAEITVTELMLQPFGVMHGGVSCLIGETLGSVSGVMTLTNPDLTVVGQSLYALHLRPVVLGMTLIAVASPQHVGKRSQIWDIALQDKATRKPTAKITLTLAVIEKPNLKTK